jgi:hypothetical protein
VEEWVPAFPTELVRGLKTHGKARENFCGLHFKRDFFTMLNAGEGLTTPCLTLPENRES